MNFVELVYFQPNYTIQNQMFDVVNWNYLFYDHNYPHHHQMTTHQLYLDQFYEELFVDPCSQFLKVF